MAKLISISHETHKDLYELITIERKALLDAGHPRNISFDDLIRQLMKHYKECDRQ